MAEDVPGSGVVERLRRLADEAGEERSWSACAALWSRSFVEARSAWARWPDQLDVGLRAIGHALAVAAGRIDTNANAAALAAIRARPVAEDDGSADWGRALVFFEMIERALAGTSANQCLLEAAQTYLDELFTAIANDLVAETGMGVITQSDARQHVLTDERWRDALAFLEAL